jgi:hypothetical protein
MNFESLSMRIIEFSYSFLRDVIFMIEEESLGNQIERSPLSQFTPYRSKLW